MYGFVKKKTLWKGDRLSATAKQARISTQRRSDTYGNYGDR